MKLSVIIPAYNEAKRIDKTLLSTYAFLSRQDYESEIIVVDDGSHDETVAKVEARRTDIQYLRVIKDAQNHGKGWVVRKGMTDATGDVRLFMDADNSTTAVQVEHFLPYFDQGYDIVVGSRRMKNSVIAVKQPWIRDFLGWAFRTIVRIIVPLGITDSQAGFKAFSKKAVDIVFSKQTIFRWAFDVELLAIARKQGLKIKEVPIVWVNDAESHVKLSGMINMLFEVLQIRLNLWAGKYD